MSTAAAVISHHSPSSGESSADWSRRLRRSPVRVQWDPERSIQLGVLPYRSLQLGLGGEAVARYVDEWTVSITDVTGLARQIQAELSGSFTDLQTDVDAFASEPIV